MSFRRVLSEELIKRIRSEKNYSFILVNFANADISTYQIRKSMGKDFMDTVFAKYGKSTYHILIDNPPTTKELKNPEFYLKRV